MRLLEGTSGYSYRAWKGSFYPAGLPASRMLSCYARQLPAVEINNTFYRLPKAGVLARWQEQVPEHFRFVLKASRRITHMKRLVDAEEETGYLLRTAGELGERLGGLLFQLPPFLKLDLDRLQRFLASLPPGPGTTFEFRHASWHCEAVETVLRDAGCGVCVTDTGTASADGGDARAPDGTGDDNLATAPGMPPPAIPVTASHAYLRLRGEDYTDDALDAWLRRLREAGPESAFVFFKHEDEAAGPALAARLRRRFDAGGTGTDRP